MNADPNLPAGVTDRDISGPDDTDAEGRTYRDRCEEEKGEIAGDVERDGGY
jgi:hypothetical protein